MKRGVGAVTISLLLLLPLFPLSASAQPEPRLRIVVLPPPIAFAGERITIFIETSIDGTPTSDVFIDPHVIHEDKGTIVINVLSPPTSFADGHFVTSFTVPDNGMGTFWIHVPGTSRDVNATGSASFRVLPRGSLPSEGGTGGPSNLAYLLLTMTAVIISLQVVLLLRRVPSKMKVKGLELSSWNRASAGIITSHR